MFKELSGRMDISVTHEMSGKTSPSLFENLKSFETDLRPGSKIEIRYNNIKGVH